MLYGILPTYGLGAKRWANLSSGAVSRCSTTTECRQPLWETSLGLFEQLPIHRHRCSQPPYPKSY